MDNVFLLKAFLSFLVGGSWVLIVTILAEKLGPKIGGIIGGIPSTLAISLFFIGITQGNEAIQKSAVMVPFILGIDAIFIALFLYFLNKRKVLIGVLSTLVIWFTLGAIGLKLKPTFLQSVVIGLLCLFISFFIGAQEKEGTAKRIKYTFWQLFSRAFFSGVMVMIVVIIAKIGGPFVGGIFAGFPIVFLSTTLILYFYHGITFSSNVMKNMVLSGVLNGTIFTAIFSALVVKFGIVLSLIIGLLATVIFSSFLLFSPALSLLSQIPFSRKN